MAYVRKTVDRWDVLTNYGFGFECECYEYTKKEALERLKEYRANTTAIVKIKKTREKKGNYKND